MKAVALLLCLVASLAEAHPRHATWAEMIFDSASGCLQTSLDVPSDDLLTTLGGPSGNDKVLHDALAELVASSYRVQIDGRRLEPRFIGYERDHRQFWLHFEFCDRPVSGSRLSVGNRLFLERNARQVNTTVLTIGDRRTTLISTREQPVAVTSVSLDP